MKTVAFVPIKMNSQRLPHKNILPLGEHALCWYIFDALLHAKGIDEVYVYCSDEEITKYIPKNVIYKKRSEKLDGNLVKGYEIYKNFIDEVDIYIGTCNFSAYKRQNHRKCFESYIKKRKRFFFCGTENTDIFMV